ncbi:site-specific integrase [Liquorilactobacillus satsumensis]|uniref:site-specific integrase n=1 Tax=Liquorilactobacillus satsumensis TaxID=259059 RepID=UPI0039E98646
MSKSSIRKEYFWKYYLEWMKTYKDGAVADCTYKKYVSTQGWIRKLLLNTTVGALDRGKYQKMINQYAKYHEKQTTTDFHHQVKACVRDMLYEGYIDRDPTWNVVVKGKPHKKKHEKFLQVDEYKKLIQNLDLSHPIDWNWAILLIAKTGLRFAEMLAITPADFDFKRRCLTVDKTWDYRSPIGGFKKTKTITSNRAISLDWQILGMFKPQIENLPKDEPIFVKKCEAGHYKRVFNATLNQRLFTLCKQQGISHISIHGLRHTHASVLLANGVSINAISERLGHANVSITQEVYAHVLDELRVKDDQKIMAVMMEVS